jgi:TonB family protein
MASFWVQNLFAYSLQIAVVAAGGAVLLRLLRIRVPNIRVFCGQALIAACLFLPAIQPWLPVKNRGASMQITTGPATVVDSPHASRTAPIPVATVVPLVLAAGVLVRMGMLCLGFWRIRRYRHTSMLTPGAFKTLQRRMGVAADFHISSDVPGPVTFGFFRPVIFMPENCMLNESIACHELVHVRRRDWLFTVAEECILTVFWFHPAMWWLVAEIQLAREEAVDREVVVLLDAREQYLQSLLTLAAARAGLDLVPASPFLRKRHLKRRVASLLKEVSMSKLRLSSSMAAFGAALVLATWMGVRAFPLQAAPQEKQESKIDAPGVAVQPSSVAVLHRTPVAYPKEALAKRIQGTVAVEVSLTATGVVSDAHVISGPEELRKAALQSVLQWHFSSDAHVATKTQVTVDFHLPEPEPASIRGVLGLTPSAEDLGTVERVILRVPEALKQKLEGRLTLRLGDPITPDSISNLTAAVKEIDEHLTVGVQRLSMTDKRTSSVIISLPENQALFALPAEGQASATPPGKIRVGGNVQAANLIKKETPVYPPLAKQARIQGVVRFTVTIGKDGTVQDVQLVSGHPLLVASAQAAVWQWQYKPVLLNGQPVEVVTTVDVNYTLTPDPEAVQ